MVKFQKAGALLDNGSQSSFITKSTCKRLGFKVDHVKHTISYLGATDSQIIETTRIIIASTTMTYEADVNFLIVSQITKPIPTKPI